MIQTERHHVIQPFVCYRIVSVPKMAQQSPVIYHQRMCQWWLQSHSTMPSIITILNCTRKFSMENERIQTVVISKQHILYPISIPTIQLFRKLIARDMKSLYIQSRELKENFYIYCYFVKAACERLNTFFYICIIVNNYVLWKFSLVYLFIRFVFVFISINLTCYFVFFFIFISIAK